MLLVPTAEATQAAAAKALGAAELNFVRAVKSEARPIERAVAQSMPGEPKLVPKFTPKITALHQRNHENRDTSFLVFVILLIDCATTVRYLVLI